MLFRFRYSARDQSALPAFQPEKPIRLDEARLALWARALGQKRKAVRPALGEIAGKPYVWHVDLASASSGCDTATLSNPAPDGTGAAKVRHEDTEN